jgi:hypothetical protein
VGKPGKDLSLVATCYHHQRSPVGIVMGSLEEKAAPPPFAVVGMHVGTMAAYAYPGQTVHFFESNPKIVELSQPKKGDPIFTYLEDARKRGAKLQVFQGKERETIAQKAPKNFYHAMVVEMCLRTREEDVCVELMTREGMALLMDKLTDTGILCYHVSNRYIDMTPVLIDVANDLGLAIRHSHDPAPDHHLSNAEHFESAWLMVGRKKEVLAKLQPPPNYEKIMKEASAKHIYLKNWLNQPYWNEWPPTGKHVWKDKSHHSLKGLMYADPGVSRLTSVVGKFVSEGIKAFAKKLDQEAANDLVDFGDQLQGKLYELSRTVAELRATAGLTIEDLQKGWPEGY